MVRRLSLVLAASVLIAGCYSGGGGAAPAPTPAGAPVPAPAGKAAACSGEAAALGPWMEMLEREGTAMVSLSSRTKLVVLGGIRRRDVAEAPIVEVTPTDVTLQGHAAQWSAAAPVPAWLEAELRAVLGRAGGTAVWVAIDETAPWAVVAGVAQAAERAGARKLELVFTAKSELTAPPESRDPRRMRDLFARCGEARAVMERLLREEGDKAPILIAELPDAIEACNCEVELPLVRRFLWHLWSRDLPGMPMKSVALAIGSGGAPVTMDPATPWSAAHAAVVAAAPGGRPVALK